MARSPAIAALSAAGMEDHAHSYTSAMKCSPSLSDEEEPQPGPSRDYVDYESDHSSSSCDQESCMYRGRVKVTLASFSPFVNFGIFSKKNRPILIVISMMRSSSGGGMINCGNSSYANNM